MQRKPTKNTRGPNAKEKRYIRYIKTEKQCCDACGRYGPLVAHHCEGATFKHNKVLIGHWFLLGLCGHCDDIVTRGSRRAFREKYGPQARIALKALEDYMLVGDQVPKDVLDAIRDWDR